DAPDGEESVPNDLWRCLEQHQKPCDCSSSVTIPLCPVAPDERQRVTSSIPRRTNRSNHFVSRQTGFDNPPRPHTHPPEHSSSTLGWSPTVRAELSNPRRPMRTAHRTTHPSALVRYAGADSDAREH